MKPSRPGLLSAVAYTAVAGLGAGSFLLATLLTGAYTWVARLGGAGWVFLLSMIILMPTLAPWMRRRLEAAPAAASLATINPGFSAASIDNAAGKDPVCGMQVKPESSKWRSEYRGEQFAFCSKGCKEAFDKDPETYAPTRQGQ